MGTDEEDKFIPWHWIHYGFPRIKKKKKKRWTNRDIKFGTMIIQWFLDNYNNYVIIMVIIYMISVTHLKVLEHSSKFPLIKKLILKIFSYGTNLIKFLEEEELIIFL